MLEYQREKKGGGGYNEVIVDAQEAGWQLPQMVEAIFETQVPLTVVGTRYAEHTTIWKSEVSVR